MSELYYKRGKTYYSKLYFPSHPKADKRGRLRIPLDTEEREAIRRVNDLLKQKDAAKFEKHPAVQSHKALEDRLLNLKKSPITKRHYVRAFANLKEALDKDIREVTPTDLVNLYRKWQPTRGLYVRNRDMLGIIAFAKKVESWTGLPGKDWEEVFGMMDQEPRGRVDFFTQAELDLLAGGTFNNWRTMTYMGSRVGGARPAEMFFCEWEDMDFDAAKFHIDSKPKYGHHIKNWERRTVPVPADALEHLRKERKRAKSQWIIANPDGERPASKDVMSTYYSRRVRDLGLDGHLYKLRHTYGSHLAQKNVPLPVIKYLMGHRSVTSTELYIHMTPGLYQEAVNTFQAISPQKGPQHL